jgi:hypothetical protein
MLYKKLSNEELEFMQAWYDPICMIESLVPMNFKAAQVWSEQDCELFKLYNYQFAMIDYTSLYADDDKLSKKQNFQNKQGAGYIINVAARNLGKSLLAWIDAVLSIIHGEANESCVSSFDGDHTRKICVPIVNFINHHPIFELYRHKGVDNARFVHGGMEIDTVLGHTCYGRSENVNDPDPGKSYHSLHFNKFIYDEISYMTDEGRTKMVDAVSLNEGCVERLAGINDLRHGSFLGKILRDESKKNWICNLPMFVREDWDDKAKARAIEEYDGETSPMYKLNVLGESIEGKDAFFDMARIKENSYNFKKSIKTFEIGKDTFYRFEQILVVDKQPAEISIIASDIGTTGSPSEICIFFGDMTLLKFRHNISLHMLTTQEQAKIFKWIYDRLDNSVISLDCTAGEGRSIADELVILGVPQDRIVRVMFNSKMIVGFETNDDGTVKHDDKGTPIHKLERTIDWAVLQLEKILYHGLCEVPHNEKFLREFANYFLVMTGTSRRYGTTSTDHLLQSFQCMAIARFNSEFTNLNKPSQQDIFVAGF